VATAAAPTAGDAAAHTAKAPKVNLKDAILLKLKEMNLVGNDSTNPIEG
jgi:hypothetical protein